MVSQGFDSSYLANRRLVIDWLIDHNFPPLPVAPACSAQEYPKVVTCSTSGSGAYCCLTPDLQPVPLFTGKNPSYLDSQGRPHLVVHSDYQTRMPTPCELHAWFENSLTGVGTLGGWNNAVWLDFDQKRFAVGSIDDSVLRVVDLIREHTNQEPFLERTHSGGWRLGVAVREKPNFTNFALSLGGSHVGEALFKGRFTVLAPTVGPSGNPYESLNRSELPLIASLESIGIFPASKCQQQSRKQSAAPSSTVAKPAKPNSVDPGSVALADLLCPNSRSILAGGNPYSDRSHSLSSLTNELFGWHNWLKHNSLPVQGDPTDLVHQAGSLLGIDPARVARIVASVGDLSSKQPAAFHLGGDLSCWKKIYRCSRSLFHRFCPAAIQATVRSDFNLDSKTSKTEQLSVSPQVSAQVPTQEVDSSAGKRQLKLVDRIKSVILTHDNEARATEALMELAVSVGKSYSDIAHLARFVRSEIDSFQELKVAISSLRPLLSHCRKRLDIRRYLAPTLADALIAAARAMPTAPEYLLNTLIPVSASRIGTSARVIVNPQGGYVQPCIFWSANVANSGQAKTPPQALIVDPLEDLDQEDRDRYQNQLADWQASTDKNKGPKPIETRRILNNVTMAQKIRIHAENPRGQLEYIDELVGDFDRHSQFSGGKGDDLRQELGLFNGKFGAYDRGDVRLYLRRVAFNKTGSYQWDTLARLMTDQVDFVSSGYLARFLLCSIVDAPERKLDLFSESSGDSLFFLLRSLYRSLENQPVRDYLLSREAKILFQAFNHSLVAAEIHESHFGLDLVYAKIESYAARLALWLHIVNATVVGEQPEPIISGETMQAAIELAAFYLWQHKLIYAHNAPTQKLDGILLKAQTCALKLWAQGKPLTSSFAKTRINSLKTWATAKIRDKIFRVLALAGFGRTEGQGEKLVYIPNDFSPPPSSPSPRDDIFTLGGVGAGLVTLSTPVSPTPQGINQIAGDDVALVASQISSSPESVASPQFVPVLQTVSSPDAPGALQLVTSVAPDSSPETASPPDTPGALQLVTSVAPDSSPETASPLDTPGSLQADTFVVPDSSPETATPLLQTTNVTNVEPQVPSSSELQPVDNPPTPSPTLGELRAILLACSNLACGNFSRVLSLRTSHKNLFKQAYVSLSPEEQSRFDGFLAASYTDSTESIYKYLGPDSNQPEGYSLLKGDLVRLRDSKLRPNLVWVLPLHAPVVLPGFHPPQFTGVNPKYLQPVQKLYPPSSAADQMSLL